MKEFLVVLFLTLLVSCLAEDTPVTLNESSSVNQCNNNEEVAKVCLQCTSLPFDVYTPLTTCCSEKSAFLFCEACVNDQQSCQKLMEEIEEVNSFSDDQDDAVDNYYDEYHDYADDTLQRPLPLVPSSGVGNVDKRFGKLFVTSPKRYGRLFFGKRSDDDFEDIDKRYGRLYMGSGSYFGKRDTMDKRYGRLYMNSKGLFGKRGGDMDNLDNAYMDDMDKRYGRLYMNSKGLFGKRGGDSEDLDQAYMDDMDKRYGRLYMNSKGLFGKRGGDMEDLGDMDVDKRYGRVYMGSNRYKLFGKRDLDRGVYDKRYGRVFMGGKGLFGKRAIETDFLLDYPRDIDELEKRFGQLYVSRNRYNMRPKFSQVNKRYGRLFTGGRRRGNYIFG